MPNQNPEQLARDKIDAMLMASGWIVQSKKNLNLNAGLGIAVREYQTDVGPADYVLFADKNPVGIIEAKRIEEAVHFSEHETQSEGYASARLKYLDNEKLPFVYESTGEVTRFTDYRDPKPSAIGVESSQKTDSRPLEKKPGMSLKDLLQNVAMGNTREDILTSLANRLIRLDKQINEKEKTNFIEQANGFTINNVVKKLLNAYDPDTINDLQLAISNKMLGEAPAKIEVEIQNQKQKLIEEAVAVFHNPDLRNYIIDVRKKYDQVIDGINIDEVINIGWVKDQQAAAQNIIHDFTAWIESNKDEITALQIFYGQPYQRRELTYKMIKDLCEKIKTEKPLLAQQMCGVLMLC
jgi:type I site-specific restriction endonuclease